MGVKMSGAKEFDARLAAIGPKGCWAARRANRPEGRFWERPEAAPTARRSRAGPAGRMPGACRKREEKMELQELRNEINRIDGEMLALLERRLAVCRAIAEYKRQNGLPVRDPAREAEKLHEAMERGGAAGQRLVALLMALGREEQERLLKGE